MKINIEKLNIEVKKYNKIINDYEEICFDFYNELNFVKEHWKGNDANYFFSNIDEEKIKIKLFCKDLYSIADIYNYLIKRYQSIGKKIIVELSEKDNIISKFNYYIDKLDHLINYYKNVDTSFDSNIREYIIRQEDTLKKNRVEINKIKEKYKKFFSNIEEVELEIKERLSKINIELLKEITPKLTSLGADTKPYMNIKNVEFSIKKLQIYKNEENIFFENIQDVLNNIIYNYNTNNKTLLENIILDVNNRKKVIYNNHLNELTILRNKIEGCKNTSNKVSQILEQIDTNIKLRNDL